MFIRPFPLLILGAFLAFCNCQSTAQPQALAVPFEAVIVTHTVADFDVWKKGFDADAAIQKANGLSLMVMGRNLDNPNDVMMFFSISELAKAKSFMADPRLKEVMDKLGVISKPDITFLKVLRFSPDKEAGQVMAALCNVKEFDAWLNGFDAEGTAKRAAGGTTDAVVARGTDDPNVAFVGLDINDLAKVKAAMMSEEKKKVMMDAGVVGPPKIGFYNIVK